MAKSEDRLLTPKEKFELHLAKEVNEGQARMIGNHPDLIKDREEQKQIREAAGKYADKLQKPSPSERMMDNREITVEQGRDAVAQRRAAEAAQSRDVSEGKRAPIKSYSELHPPDPKTRSR